MENYHFLPGGGDGAGRKFRLVRKLAIGQRRILALGGYLVFDGLQELFAELYELLLAFFFKQVTFTV